MGLMCCTVLFCRFLFSCINKKLIFSDIDVSLEKQEGMCFFIKKTLIFYRENIIDKLVVCPLSTFDIWLKFLL